MAVELITGRAGAPHIDAPDVGRLLAGVMGREAYVIGPAPTVTMRDANTCSIGACDVVAHGRHISIGVGTTAAIANGTQTGHRRDLVCLRYSRDPGTDIESASVVVLQGTTVPSKAAAADPQVGTGTILDGTQQVDVPIARVTLDGLLPAAEWLLPVVPPLASLAEVGRVERGKVNGNLSYERLGSLVIAHVFNVHNGKDAGYMPVGMRPSATAYGGASASQYGGFVRVEPSGRVLVWSEADGEFTGQCVYLAV